MNHPPSPRSTHPGRARGLLLRTLALYGLCTLSGCGPDPATCAWERSGAPTEWPSYGNDPGGRRFSALDQIRRENVACLEEAWVFRTGDLPDSRGEHPSDLASEVTPTLVDDTLYLCTPYNRVLALDPETGRERWSFDPKLDLSGHYANQLVCRGVAPWLDAESGAGEVCSRTMPTVDTVIRRAPTPYP